MQWTHERSIFLLRLDDMCMRACVRARTRFSSLYA